MFRLVCGDVQGQFDRVFKKVAALHNGAAGPFDMLLCVGQFFATPTGAQLADDAKAVAQHQLSEYIEGFKAGAFDLTASFPRDQNLSLMSV